MSEKRRWGNFFAVLLVTGILLLAFALPAFAESEPNDDYLNAGVLEVNQSQAGTIGMEKPGGSIDYYDWYKITTTADGKLEVDVSSDAEIDLYLYYVDGGYTRTLSSDYSGYKTKRHVEYDVAAGTYYVKVYRDRGAGGYTITAKLTSPEEVNDSEPNNSWDKAQILGENETLEGHIGYKSSSGATDGYDWYKITTTADGKLEADVSSDAEIDLYLYYVDDGYTRTLSSDYSGYKTECHVEYDVAAGTYYVKVDHDRGAGGYTITSTLTSPGVANDSEPNDDREYANLLGVGGTLTGHIGYRYSNGKTDDYDYYKINFTSGGSLWVDVSSDAKIDLYLYDSNGHSISSDYSGYKSTRAVRKDDLAPGTYYVKVDHDRGAGGYYISCNTPGNIPQPQPLKITRSDPAGGAVDVPVDKTIRVTFDKNIQAGSAYDGIQLSKNNGTTVAVTKSISGSSLTIEPDGNLDYETTYTVSIPANAVVDANGNTLAGSFTFSFTTGERSETPGGGDYNEWKSGTVNDPNKEWTIRFSQPLDPGTVNDDNIYVENDTRKRVGVSLNYDNNDRSVVVRPPAGGYESGSYTLYIERSLRSAKGRQLKKAVKMEFTVTAEHEPVTGKTAVLTHGGFDFSTEEFYGFDDDSPDDF